MENMDNLKIQLNQEISQKPGFDLPDLPLLEIFDKLNAKGRQNSRLTSRRWADLIREVSKVTLDLNFCLISPKCPPWTTLFDSNIKYQHIIIGNGLLIDGDATPFWEAIGEHVETISWHCNEPLSRDFLKNFPKLNKINQPFSIYLPSKVEHVNIYQIFASDWRNVKEELRENQVKVFTTEKIDVDEEGISFYISPKLNILDIENMEVDHCVGANCATIFSSKFEILTIMLDSTNCSGYHEKFELQSVNELSIYCNSEPCSSCLQYLKDGFPNLKKLKLFGKLNFVTQILEGFKHDLIQLEITDEQEERNDNGQLIPLNFPSLEVLKISGFSNMNIDKWSSMQNLTKLDLETYGDFTIEMLNDLIEKAPNLVDLDLTGTALIQNPREFFEMMANAWNNLEKLRLELIFRRQKVRESDFIDSIQEGNFGELRYIEHYFEKDEELDSKKLRMELFDKLPKLRKTAWMTYAMYCAEKYQVDLDEDDLYRHSLLCEKGQHDQRMSPDIGILEEEEMDIDIFEEQSLLFQL